MVAGKALAIFCESGAIQQSFIHPNLCCKTAGRLKIHHNE